MKKIIIFLSLFILVISISSAQDSQEGYIFKILKKNPITSIKNQANSGTCWSFSGVAFLESELIRMGKGEHDISEMYIVRRNYLDKGEKYIRVGGNLNYSQGGSFADVVETINEYGVLPENIYSGLNYGEEVHKHSEVEAALKGYLSAVESNKNGRLSTAWLKGLDGILEAYFGTIPAQFDYQGKKYTPQEFARSLGLNADNYISFTSFSHHPFYKPFALEVSDNWRWAISYNLPIDDMIAVIDNAINSGYTVAWAADVSEASFTRNGVAMIPDEEANENIGSDQARWLGLSAKEKQAYIKAKIEKAPVKEKQITQDMRQVAFDNYETTDDHGMQIFGIAKDQHGTKYYMVKNSWGEAGMYKGIWYVSEAYVKYKTTSFVVNKESLPKAIIEKLKI